MVTIPTPTTSLPDDWTAADMLRHLGGVPLDRIRVVPPPGLATEQDLVQVHARSGCLCELIDGVLVEKPTGYYESRVAMVIEVLSEGNTEKEMERKLQDCFAAGVRLVWYVDPELRSARAFTAPDDATKIPQSGTLLGDVVLPGFERSLVDLFARVERQR